MPEASVAIQERGVENHPMIEAPSQQHAAAMTSHWDSSALPRKDAPTPGPSVEASTQVAEPPAKTSPKLPSKRPPALILRKGANGSELLLSGQTRCESARPSSIAAALVFAGPALALAGAYYLLINFGWL